MTGTKKSPGARSPAKRLATRPHGKPAHAAPRASRREDEDDASAAETVREFERVVNMTPRRLIAWLDTEESRAVGFRGAAGGESVGHRSGRRIVRLLAKARDELTSGDRAHMRKVIGYVRRHLAQRPSGDVSDTPWRYSLMNWGHDPARPGSRRAG